MLGLHHQNIQKPVHCDGLFVFWAAQRAVRTSHQRDSTLQHDSTHSLCLNARPLPQTSLALLRHTANWVTAVEFISYEATLETFQQEWLAIVKGKLGKRS